MSVLAVVGGAPVACTGSEPASDTDAGPGLAGAGGSGAGAGTGGAAGSSGCPTAAPSNGYETCAIGAGESCEYTFDCQSGVKTFELICSPTGPAPWAVKTTVCEHAYDSCPGAQLYCDGVWELTANSDPPTPCPAKRPKEGDSCPNATAFGGARKLCGYPCDEVAKTGWTIASCLESTTWKLDGACAVDGG